MRFNVWEERQDLPQYVLVFENRNNHIVARRWIRHPQTCRADGGFNAQECLHSVLAFKGEQGEALLFSPANGNQGKVSGNAITSAHDGALALWASRLRQSGDDAVANQSIISHDGSDDTWVLDARLMGFFSIRCHPLCILVVS